MKFYNNIFASSYGLYAKYYDSSRAIFRSKTIVAVHMIGLLFVLIALIKKLFSVDYSSLRYASSIIALGVLAMLLFLLTKYYSKERVDAVLKRFENIGAGTRRLWKFLTLTTLVAEYIVFALLLRK